MRRLGLAIIVTLLALSASGLSALVFAEPCASNEQQEDAACPPTCVTCGCCAQAVEPVSLAVESSPADPTPVFDHVIPRVPTIRARKILHVPKLRLA